LCGLLHIHLTNTGHQLNTSRLGHFSTSNKQLTDRSLFDGIEGNITSGINGVQGIAGNVANDLAKDLGLHDFYTAHVMNYCEGFYKGNDTTRDAAMNVTSCSKPKRMYSFDPTTIIQRELRNGVSLQDIKWPEQIEDGLKALSIVARAMFVLYTIGIAATGLTILTGLAGMSGNRLWSAVNFSLSFVRPLSSYTLTTSNFPLPAQQKPSNLSRSSSSPF
jgi:hypothetical protein